METATVKTTNKLIKTLDRIELNNSVVNWEWKWKFTKTKHGWLLKARFTRPDTNTGQSGFGYSREEFVRKGASEDSVIKTAYVILKLTVEHELMEAFHVDDKRVFDPHRTIEQLKN